MDGPDLQVLADDQQQGEPLINLPDEGRRRALMALGCGLLSPIAGCRHDPLSPGKQRVPLWFTYGGKNREVLGKLVAKFNARSTGVQIDPIYQGDYFEGLAKLRTALFAQAAPALTHVIGEVVPYLAEASVLESLDDYPGADSLGVLPELGQAKSWVDGHRHPLFALPFNRSTPIAYINKGLFDRLGLSAPKTWDELIDVARAATLRAGPNRIARYGFGCPISWWFWVAMVGQAGGQVIDSDGRVSLGGEAGVDALRLWQRLVREQTMRPPPGRDYNAWEQTNQDFLAGRSAMIWTSTAFVRYLEQNAPFEIETAELPGRERRAVPTGGTFWVIIKNAPRQQKRAAWQFLRFMHESPQVIEWATSTGYLPTTRAAIERLERTDYYVAHRNDRVAYDQLRHAMPWPWSVELFRIQREIVQPRLEAAVLGRQDPSPLLKEARRVAQSLR